jgi:hypothetical protein
MSPSRNPESAFSLDGETSAPAPGVGPTAPAAQSATATRRPVKRGFFVPITTTGQLDIDRVRDPEGLERARAALGVVDPATIPPPEKPKINKEFILPAYSLLEVGIRFVGRKALHWPDALAEKMAFSPEKKQALVEPTATVLSRYAPAWLVANQDIAALGAALADAVDDMIQRGVKEYVTEVQAQHAAETQRAANARFTTPIPPNGVAAAA